jgi:hypothetical protein
MRRSGPGAAVCRAVCCCALLLSAGCRLPLSGEWRAIEARPGRHVFLMDEVSFDPQGRYQARLVRGGITTLEEGDYEFTGSRLKLRPSAGGLHSFSANRTWDRLEIRDKDQIVVLRKSPRQP